MNLNSWEALDAVMRFLRDSCGEDNLGRGGCKRLSVYESNNARRKPPPIILSNPTTYLPNTTVFISSPPHTFPPSPIPPTSHRLPLTPFPYPLAPSNPNSQSPIPNSLSPRPIQSQFPIPNSLSPRPIQFPIPNPQYHPPISTPPPGGQSYYCSTSTPTLSQHLPQEPETRFLSMVNIDRYGGAE